jgi:hypothetical protein
MSKERQRDFRDVVVATGYDAVAELFARRAQDPHCHQFCGGRPRVRHKHVKLLVTYEISERRIEVVRVSALIGHFCHPVYVLGCEESFWKGGERCYFFDHETVLLIANEIAKELRKTPPAAQKSTSLFVPLPEIPEDEDEEEEEFDLSRAIDLHIDACKDA